MIAFQSTCISETENNLKFIGPQDPQHIHILSEVLYHAMDLNQETTDKTTRLKTPVASVSQDPSPMAYNDLLVYKLKYVIHQMNFRV